MHAHDRYDTLIRWYATLYKRDARQVKAQIRAESAFDPQAKSPVGACGLLQFMPRTWEEWCDGTAGLQAPPSGVVFEPTNPEQSINAGCAYMAALQRSLGSLPLALAAYNWGIGHVRKVKTLENWREQLPAETRAYVRKCLAYEGESLS